MTVVSRETLAQPKSGGGKYVSPFRQGQGERTRTAILEAALQLIRKGRFRPEARELASLADIHRSAVVRHFGSLQLLYNVIAREHADKVLQALGIEPMDDARTCALQDDLVWIAMTGHRRPPL
jgi:AcrR family transcriptional regulator